MVCDYCYAPPRPDLGMTFETGKKAMMLGAQMNQQSCGIVFFGGEPLLHKSLIQKLVYYGKELERETGIQYYFKLTTNGILLDEAFIDFSIRHHVLIAMSFDGIRKAHDRHRRFQNGQSSFELLLKKMKMLIQHRPYSSILMVVNPDTAPFFEESVRFLLDLSCRYIIVSLNHTADWKPSDFNILKKEFHCLAKDYIRRTKEGRKFYFSPFEVKLSSHINKHCYHKERCELAQNQISIDPEGFFYPCVQFTQGGPESEWCIGNVFKGIDEDKRQNLFEKSQAEKATCQDCVIKERCNNTCGCLNWQTTQSINQVSPVLCQYEQMLMPIVDRIGHILYKKRNPYFIHKHYNSAYPVISLIEDVGT